MKRLTIVMMICLSSSFIFAQGSSVRIKREVSTGVTHPSLSVSSLNRAAHQARGGRATAFAIDFEDEEDWTFDFTPWTVNDVDGLDTYGFTGIEFPNEYDPMAYIVFNPATTVPPMTSDPDIQPHSGDRFGACMASVPSGSQGNDDWLMTPYISLGDDPSITFWAKSYTDEYGLEKFNLGVSTTTNDPDDFTIISGTTPVSVPTVWTEYTYSLANYANIKVYIGIECVSFDAFVFMLDDIEVIGGGVSDPDIAVNPSSMEETLEPDATSTQTLTVTNNGGSDLTYSVTIQYPPRPDSWLTVVPDEGTVPAFSQEDLTVTFDATGLTEGTYLADINIDSNDPDEPTVTVPVTLTVEVIGPTLWPPNNLQAEVNDYDVMLTWEAPGVQPTWIHWDDGTNYNGIGLTNGGTFYVAARFGPDQLMDYDGMSLTKLAIYPRAGSTTTYALKVWIGANAGTLILTQPIAPIADQWNEFDLTPIIIDATQELWIGYTCTHPAGDTPAGCDAGPAVAGWGDMISTNGTSWSSLAGLGYDYNWNIQGYVDFTAAPGGVPNHAGWISHVPWPLSRALLGYNVYRDEVQLNTTPVTDLFYADNGLTPGTYSYTVTALYDEGESEPAGPVEVVVTGPSCDPVNNLTAYNVPGSPDVHLSWSQPGPQPTWIHWDDGTNYDAIGLTNGGTFYVAARFGPDQLMDYDGMSLTKLAIYPRAGSTTTYTLKVWIGANAGTQVLTQPVTPIAEQWNEFDLTTPVVINATQELWIGYACTHPAGDTPAGCDAGPAVAGWGDMISTNGTSWSSLAGLGYDYNWNIQGYIDYVTGKEKMTVPLVHNSSGPSGETMSVDMIRRGMFKPGLSFIPYTLDRALIGYNVYRDGSLLTPEPITDLYYDDLGLALGTYEYCVTAQYDECESEPVCVSVDITEAPCDPVSNLVIENEPGSPDVTVTWSPPGSAWIHWDDGTNYDGIGLTGGGLFYVAARFGPNQLADYDGMSLTTVALFPRGPNTTYTLKVWVGANAGTLVVDEPLTTLTFDVWNQVELSTPVTINASQELWIGYSCDQPNGDTPAGCDAGPAVLEYGDLISVDGTSWDDLADYGLSYNWNIQGLLEIVTDERTLAEAPVSLPFKQPLNETTLTGHIALGHLKTEGNTVFNPGIRELLGYNVYRNGNLMTENPITDLFYEDLGLPNGTYEYCVTAVYDDCESDPVCGTVDITVGIDNPWIDELTVYPNPASGYLYITTSGLMESLTIVNYAGQTVYSGEDVKTASLEIPVSSFTPGLYFVRVRTGTGIITKKIAIR
jgi:hypothetical protein